MGLCPRVALRAARRAPLRSKDQRQKTLRPENRDPEMKEKSYKDHNLRNTYLPFISLSNSNEAYVIAA